MSVREEISEAAEFLNSNVEYHSWLSVEPVITMLEASVHIHHW